MYSIQGQDELKDKLYKLEIMIFSDWPKAGSGVRVHGGGIRFSAESSGMLTMSGNTIEFKSCTASNSGAKD